MIILFNIDRFSGQKGEKVPLPLLCSNFGTSIRNDAMKCKVEECIGQRVKGGYCNKHYLQMYRHGKILSRTRFDSNESIIKGAVVEIQLYDRHNGKSVKTIIDAEDYDKVKDYKWGFDGKYVATYVNRKKIYLHKLIFDSDEVDHDSRNKLDNRKINLRGCTHQQNLFNQNLNCRNTSGYKGVSYDKKREKWEAYIKINGKKKHIGRYETATDAALAYDKKAVEYFGEFLATNKMLGLL